MAKKTQQQGPSILITYYTGRGNTGAAAEALARQLQKAGCPVALEKLEDGINRTGFFGFLRTGFQALFKKEVPVYPPQHNPAEFDFTVIGSPTYAGTMAPAVRTWITQNRTRIHNCAFFGTGGDKKKDKVLQRMADVAGTDGTARMYIPEKVVQSGNYLDRITIFMDGLGITV